MLVATFYMKTYQVESQDNDHSQSFLKHNHSKIIQFGLNV